ncbi:DUF397 domain-containing protein [Actinomadura craniellae]|uniref:DUF397 domain-containing protein n=1 Tax=Actinomadura craniellae TaxID=2231787 RepID=A0A365H1D1_9ACTN|nr:DUF397 domain-containing protein [Actinomadura craniellae]RAY12836.1 DUF397 domain-containing protein [Actinomadura craniellae]
MSVQVMWRKSSRSGGSSGQTDCVEVAALTGSIGIRDSKAPEAGHLRLSNEDFAALIASVKHNEPSA